MSDREIAARPNLEQYKKQAKDLVSECGLGVADAGARVRRHHPRFHTLGESEFRGAKVTLADAQLVIAREHGFESWPKFSHHIAMVNRSGSVESLADPVRAFLEVACAPRHGSHGGGTLEHAEMILARYPEVARSNIYTAAVLGDEAGVRGFLARNAGSATSGASNSATGTATSKGGPHGWDALTHLCFSRYLRIDKARSEAFVRTARALLDAGASAKTGWVEMIDYPNPRPLFESAIYGAAGVAQNAELTRLLLERGADPNDEETPYHAPEGYDNTVMRVLLESGRLNEESLICMLIRKTDWHDEEGLRLVLEHGGDPNMVSRFGDNALHHGLRRDNGLVMIEMMLERGADPAVKNTRDGRSAMEIAADRGRGDVLGLLKQRGFAVGLEGVARLVAACAEGDRDRVRAIAAEEPERVRELVRRGGALLPEFAGNNNVEGIGCLLEVGVSAGVLYEGDGYFEIAKDSTALHVAAWRGWPAAVRRLIEAGVPVNALDGRGRTALQLAVKACVDSYWKYRRSPDSVDALLLAGATVDGVEIPTGYEEVDELLARYGR